MAFHARSLRPPNACVAFAEGKTPDSLPAVLRKQDLVLLIVLFIVVVPITQGMEFAGTAVFFYWFLALLTFQLPSICVFGWLMRQAPRHVPCCVWILRLLPERWRSALLFLLLGIMVLMLLAILGMNLALLQSALPSWAGTLPAQSLTFAFLLIAATLLASLPLPLLRNVLWGCGLCYLAFFGLLGAATLIGLLHGHAAAGAFPHSLATALPAHFSWSLFGLALWSLVGLNMVFFLDGEVHGAERYLRHSTSVLWWGGFGSFLLVLVGSIAWLVLAQLTHGALDLLIGPVLGPGAALSAGLLLLLGSFGIALVFLLIFSRVVLLAARQGFLPRRLTQLNRAGTPLRALLSQSAVTGGLAALLFVVMPALLRAMLPAMLFNELVSGDQFSLFASTAGSAGALVNALLFVFALWLFWKKCRQRQRSWGERLGLPALCVSGFLASLVCALAPLTQEWPSLFLSHDRWFVSIIVSLTLVWVLSELPRRSALLREKEQSLVREKALHEELQQVYNRLREAYDEQQVAILQQRLLLKEVNRLYQEQERMAKTDPVTGLLNHRAFIGRLEEAIARAQQEARSFLLVFLDLDHFKAINDTWGHLAGDEVLRGVGQRLQETLRPGEVAARYGGEEFVLILDGVTITQAHEEAERLRRIIQAPPYRWQSIGETWTEIVVTASIGAAAYGIHGMLSEELLEQVDQAMYQAKLAGRDCVRIAGAHLPAAPFPLPLTHASARYPHDQVTRLIEGNEPQLPAQVIQGLKAVMQACDHTTSSHASRLVRLAEETGRRLGASPEDLFLMRLGGLFHDLGKIGIPDAILNKPGSLNEEEWKIMQQHPVIGARILEKMEGEFHPLAQIILAHHERWDGHGYPQGLQGQEIPLAARVLGVIDAYDTMVSRRPYKGPMPVRTAEAELRRCSGTQFDPAVVQAFLTLLKTSEPDQVSRSDHFVQPY